MDTDSYIVYIKTEDVYIDIAEDVEIRFDTSNHELDTPLCKRKSKIKIELTKDELGRNKMAASPKIYSYLAEERDKHKKGISTKKCVIN